MTSGEGDGGIDFSVPYGYSATWCLTLWVGKTYRSLAQRLLTVHEGCLEARSCEFQTNSGNSINYAFICNRKIADPIGKSNTQKYK